MGSSPRGRYWSLLQVVVIVVCGRGIASSEVAQGCVESRLMLNCPEMKVIQITAVVLGDSYCSGSSCCITNSDCTEDANEDHRMDVHRECDNKRSCAIDVLREKIPCGLLDFLYWPHNDFERIRYDCREEPRNTVITTDGTNTELSNQTETVRKHDNGTSIEDGNNEVNSMEADRKATLPVIMVSLILVILVAIVALAVFVYRRKLFAQEKVCDPVAMTKIGNRQNETDVNANEDHGATVYSCVEPADEAAYSPTEDDPIVYSEVEQRKLVWKYEQRDPLATDKTKATVEAHAAEPYIYTTVNKPSKAPPTSSAARTAQMEAIGIVNKSDCSQDQIYSLASNDSEDIYANEPALQSTGLMTATISKTPMPQLEVGQTVIENDLYCH